MKKLLMAACIALCITACTENETKTESSTNSTETKATDPGEATKPSEAQRREKEINDSTKMLDKKLADPTDTSTGGNPQ